LLNSGRKREGRGTNMSIISIIGARGGSYNSRKRVFLQLEESDGRVQDCKEG